MIGLGHYTQRGRDSALSFELSVARDRAALAASFCPVDRWTRLLQTGRVRRRKTVGMRIFVGCRCSPSEANPGKPSASGAWQRSARIGKYSRRTSACAANTIIAATIGSEPRTSCSIDTLANRSGAALHCARAVLR